MHRRHRHIGGTLPWHLLMLSAAVPLPTNWGAHRPHRDYTDLRLDLLTSCSIFVLSLIKAPFSVMWRQRTFTSVYHTLCVLLDCYDLLRSHYMYCSTECTSAESTNLLSGSSCLHLSSFGQSLKNRDPWPQPSYNRICIKARYNEVQCT